MKKICKALVIISVILFFCSESFALDPRINSSPSAAEFIIPHSDTEKISVHDIATLDLKIIELAKNEIYARHGLVFQFPEMNKYFTAKTWYKANKNFQKNTLNYFEASNVRLLEEILSNPQKLKQSPPSVNLPVKKEEQSGKKSPMQEASETLAEMREENSDEIEKLLISLRAKTPKDEKISIDIKQPAQVAVKTNDMPQKTSKPASQDVSPPSPAEIKKRVQESVLPKPKEPPKVNQSKADAIIATARSLIGTRYRMGGNSPSAGFDCSGFVQWVYSRHGIKTSRSTPQLARDGVAVSTKDMKPGDVVIISNRRGRDSPNGLHAGIYVGGGSMIHAPGRGKRVIQVKLTYYKIIGGRRVMK